LQAFVFERIKSFLRDDLESTSNVKFDIRIVEALEKQFFNKPFTKAKEFVFEINERLKQTEENSLRAALIPYHRAKNITQNAIEMKIDESKFTSDFEKNLYQKLISTKKEIDEFLEKDDLKSYLNALQNLTKPLAELFENVMINDPNPDLKQNRISMLCKICALYERFANFSLIQVQ
jgi:glycyl-tRNA synthetase beta subunit